MKKISILLIVIGVIFYFCGFFLFSIYGTILLSVGTVMIFLPLIKLGLDLKSKGKGAVSYILIGVSTFFIVCMLFYLIGYLYLNL